MADAPTVALLGTGTMGAGMARSIAGAGLRLRVWNRTRERAEPLAGVATVADTAADAVRGADVLVTMLFDADSVAAAVAEAGDALGPGTVWLQTTTVGVHGERQVAGVAGDLGVPYVDAPVLGTRGPAEQGKLVVLASGPKLTVEDLPVEIAEAQEAGAKGADHAVDAVGDKSETHREQQHNPERQVGERVQRPEIDREPGDRRFGHTAGTTRGADARTISGHRSPRRCGRRPWPRVRHAGR